MEKGSKHSIKTRKKMKMAQLGDKNHFFGKTHSLKVRKKISLVHKGKKLTEAHKLKFSKLRKGRLNGNYGNKYSLKTRKLLSDLKKGNKSPTWKGGITPLLQLIRTSYKYRLWRSDVFTRDNFKCVMCDSKIKIEVDHHPQSFIYIFNKNKIKTLEDALNCEEFWNINNGRTLCHKCHYKIHWKKSINKEGDER